MEKRKKQRSERRAFSAEFKAEAVRLCKVGDRSVTQVAADLDLTETALREWVKRSDVDAGNGPPGALTTDERAELAQLRRENKRLLMERESLKKKQRPSLRRRAREVRVHPRREGALPHHGALPRLERLVQRLSCMARSTLGASSSC
jgi:transposase